MRLAALALAALLPAAHAWWSMPHTMTAHIALLAMDAPVQRVVLDLINVLAPFYPDSSMPPAAAATWADEIKGATSVYNNWHFFDNPILRNVSSGPPLNPINALYALNLTEVALAAPSGPLSTPMDKALALRFYIHILGDIHQPLHCATLVTPQHTKGDSGGNLFLLNNTFHNLHAYWDSGAGQWGDPVVEDWDEDIRVATELFNEYPYTNFSTFVLGECNYTKFLLESLDLAANVVYQGIQSGGQVSPEYQTRAQELVRRQIVLGGLRLGECLNNAIYALGVDYDPTGAGARSDELYKDSTIGLAVGCGGLLLVSAVLAFRLCQASDRAALTAMHHPEASEAQRPKSYATLESPSHGAAAPEDVALEPLALADARVGAATPRPEIRIVAGGSVTPRPDEPMSAHERAGLLRTPKVRPPGSPRASPLLEAEHTPASGLADAPLASKAKLVE